ncbi:MAG: Fic family protein [Rickettsiaceae bacterium]
MTYKPPFTITNNILNLCQGVSKELGFLEGTKILTPSIQLRKDNQIKTIQSSLAIEGNSLSEEHITHILEGRRVLAPEKDIIEVENALKLYQTLNQFDALSISSILEAHSILMQSLIAENGKWRSGGVGIISKEGISHMAPQAKMVSGLMSQLFEFLKREKELSWLIKACVFHYELEFIHPFSDGNGRMGRLWQQLLLMKEHNVFEYLSIESLIKKNQKEYYTILSACDKQGESTLFIEFMLRIILKSLSEYSKGLVLPNINCSTRLEYSRKLLANKCFSRKDYILVHKNISMATASRDLKWGLENKLLLSEGSYNQIKYSYIK